MNVGALLELTAAMRRRARVVGARGSLGTLRALSVATAMAWGAAALTGGCATERTRAEPSPESVSVSAAPPPAPAPPSAVSSKNAAWITQLREVHQAVDGAQTPAKKRAALGGLEQLFESRPPQDMLAAELLPVRQDLADRAARLELSLGNAQDALSWTSRGLGLSTEPSVFRANLLLTTADAHEALGQKKPARTALMQALKVNRALLDRELENP